MANEKVYGIYENKCRVEIYPKTQVYNKSETYSKTEVDAKIAELSNRIAQLEKESAQWSKDISDLQSYTIELDRRITALGG